MDHIYVLVHSYTVTNLFKSTELNIAFRAFNTIYNQLCCRLPINKINSSGIYKLQCKICNKSYVGQTGSSIEIRHREPYKKEIKIIEAAMFKCTRFANLYNFLILCSHFLPACSLITNRRIGPRIYTRISMLLDGVC
jgi:hypothetical protein